MALEESALMRWYADAARQKQTRGRPRTFDVDGQICDSWDGLIGLVGVNVHVGRVKFPTKSPTILHYQARAL
jgi:hypothetical protein